MGNRGIFRKLLFFSLLGGAASNLFASSVVASDWPRSTPQREGLDHRALKRLEDFVFDPRAHHRSDALVLIKNGRLVHESYANGYSSRKRHMFWSLSKSLTSVLSGIAVHRGLWNLEDPLYYRYPRLREGLGSSLRLVDLLQMSSGIDWFEEHPTSLILSDSIFVHYSRKGFLNAASYVFSKGFLSPPGQSFNYSSGDSNVVMDFFRRKIGNDTSYYRFPWDEFFNKLSMKSITFNVDHSGSFLGASGYWGTAQDLARVGQLMLNDGVWNGERLLPKGWVEFSTTLAPSLKLQGAARSQLRLNQEAYGASWWLNRPIQRSGYKKPFPALDETAYLAMGFRGQTMIVLPKHDVVLVRLGSDGRQEEKKIDRKKLSKLLMEVL